MGPLLTTALSGEPDRVSVHALGGPQLVRVDDAASETMNDGNVAARQDPTLGDGSEDQPFEEEAHTTSLAEASRVATPLNVETINQARETGKTTAREEEEPAQDLDHTPFHTIPVTTLTPSRNDSDSDDDEDLELDNEKGRAPTGWAAYFPVK